MDHLYFHLVGASVAFLLLGMPLALLALACTTLVTCITLQTSPWIWGMQFILAAVLPLMIIALLHHLVKRTLPHRLFVYIFIRGFFVAAIGMMLAMFINLSLIGQVFGFIPLAGNPIVWASPILLGWGEGFLSGAAIALIATYNPDWLYRHAPFKGMWVNPVLNLNTKKPSQMARFLFRNSGTISPTPSLRAHRAWFLVPFFELFPNHRQ